MFNRRFLRIKVMQALYSRRLQSDAGLLTLEKNLAVGLRNSWRAFLAQFIAIEQMARQTEAFHERQTNRYRQDLEVDIVPLALPDNPLITAVAESEQFAEMLNEYKLVNFFPSDLLFNLFQALKKKEFFWKYTPEAIAEKGTDLHRRTINSLFKKVILKNDDYTHFLEEKFINWQDDAQLIILTVNKVVRTFFEREEPYITYVLPQPDWEELDAFCRDLLNRFDKHEAELNELITPALKNWEAARVNTIDYLIIQMAVCEFLHFPDIPVKVTINEYIEVAKTYSTPRSREFVNGVLDSILAQLQTENRIAKRGRGLIG